MSASNSIGNGVSIILGDGDLTERTHMAEVVQDLAEELSFSGFYRDTCVP